MITYTILDTGSCFRVLKSGPAHWEIVATALTMDAAIAAKRLLEGSYGKGN